MEKLIDGKFELFTEGATLIFKICAAFRLTLDHIPEFLDEYIEDEEDEENDELEINFLLKALFEDIYLEIQKGSIDIVIAKMLYDFLSENYDTYLEDESEQLVARSLKKLYTEINENKTEFIDKLREVDKTFNYSVYSIKFPIEEIQDEIKTNDKMEVDNEPDEDGFVEVKKGKMKI